MADVNRGAAPAPADHLAALFEQHPLLGGARVKVERRADLLVAFEPGRDDPTVAVAMPATASPRDVGFAVRRVADYGPGIGGPEAYVVEGLEEPTRREALVGAAVGQAAGLGLHGHDYPARRALVVRVASPGQE